MTAPRIPVTGGVGLADAVAAIVDQARQKVRFDDADRSGVTIHAGLLRALAIAAGLDPLPAYSATLARSEALRAYINADHWCGQTGE